VQSIGDHAIRRFENQVSEQYYEQDILEKCGVATPTPSSASTSRSGSNSVSGASNSPAPAPRHSAAATSGGGALPVSPRSAVDEQHQLPKLPSLKVLNSEADALRERSSIHEEYMKAILEHLSPMLRVLHVFRVMNQVPELAAFYNANRLVGSLPSCFMMYVWLTNRRCAASTAAPVVPARGHCDCDARQVRRAA
jgi:hypothetical protein